MRELQKLVRRNIWALKPYSSARSEFTGKAEVLLDANENPYNAPYNRYPDPLQRRLKEAIAPLKQIPDANIFLGNGSDEAIDVLFRVFCEPGRDNVVAIDPTYGMYEVCADINDVEYRKVPLSADFAMSAEAVLRRCDRNTKLVFVCSPNNPTGNAFPRDEIMRVVEGADCIVVLDEAYSDFMEQAPLRCEIARHANLVVLNTFSKAFGCAAVRLGLAYASTDIVGLMNKVKYPYNINQLTQEKALEVLSDITTVHQRIVRIKEARGILMQAFAQLPICQRVYATDANFFLARVDDADAVYAYLVERGIIVRNRTRVALCHDCLRVTVGSREENEQLLKALRLYVK